MKALLIISSLPDIIFIHADKGFVKHINKLSREAGFIGEDHNEDEMDTTALSQIFSPMITSLTYMNELGNPYSSILCEDGTLFVFRQVSVMIGSIFAVLWVLPRRELERSAGLFPEQRLVIKILVLLSTFYLFFFFFPLPLSQVEKNVNVCTVRVILLLYYSNIALGDVGQIISKREKSPF